MHNHRAVAICFLFFLTVLMDPRTWAQTSLVDRTSAERAETLLKQMTVEEKIGQLSLASGAAFPGRPHLSDQTLAQGKVGSVLWLADPKEIDRIQQVAVTQSRLHIPLIFALDVIHGYDTMFPIPLAMASSWDPSLEEAVQSFAAKEAYAVGVRWTFAPMVDITRDARWGRIQEGAGEDPYLGSQMAKAQIRGFQGESLGPYSVIACAKHFAGYGAAEGGRDYDSAYLPEVLLRNVYLKPFHEAVEAGVGSFMSAYMNLNDVPSSANRWLLTDVLRDEWGFKGLLTSDAQAIRNLQAHGFAADPRDAAFKAFSAGAGIEMATELFGEHLPSLIAQGRVTETQLDAAVRPILAIKYQIGLFDQGAARAAEVPNHAEGLALARKVATQSMVLLKNENKTLPLGPHLKSVAVLGVLADSGFDTQGGPSASGMFTHAEKYSAVSVLSALREHLGSGATISYVPGPGLSRAYRSAFETAAGYPSPKKPTPAQVQGWLRKAKTAADQADVIIAVLGETAFMSGEEGSRATLGLPGIQQQMLEAAADSGKPVVLVLLGGRPLDIQWASDHVPAILAAWLPGAEGGHAIADVIFGEVNPGGKLPVSWPRSVGQEPLYYDHDRTHHPEDAAGFTSRYWDLSSFPLYRFGYGLSYTNFKFANLRLKENRIKPGDTTQVYVDVTNIGARTGDTVGQLYIHQRSGSASRPARQLVGFQRVTLRPGEARTLTFTLGQNELGFWSPQTKVWAVEPETFDVWAGEDSAAALESELTVNRE